MAYVTAQDIKHEMPDIIPSGNHDYDAVLRENAEQASRFVDKMAARNFYATTRILYRDIDKDVSYLWLPDLLEMSDISVSEDDGDNYTDLVATDYFLYGGPYLDRDVTPYYQLKLAKNGDYPAFYQGQNAVKIEGIWGWHSDYANAWEDIGVVVDDDPLVAGATIINVLNADVRDALGEPLLDIGQILKLEEEQVEITHVDLVNNQLTVKRARQGTTAAEHDADTPFYLYHADELVRRVCTIQAMRWFKRGQQGYADTAADVEAGKLRYSQRMDPDIAVILREGGLGKVWVH